VLPIVKGHAWPVVNFIVIARLVAAGFFGVKWTAVEDARIARFARVLLRLHPRMNVSCTLQMLTWSIMV
jgi:hypothetical protein